MILSKEIEFILAIDALKKVERRNYILDDSRRENSAEHSWQIMVFAQILLPYAKDKEHIDLLKVLKMLSIHDIVEIYAGDTFAYEQHENDGKYEREYQSAQQIFGILDEPIKSEFLNLWIEFEEKQSPEAIFANAIDRIMPFILNAHTSAKSWTQANITEAKARNVIEKAVKNASDALGEAFEVLLNKAIEEGKLLK